VMEDRSSMDRKELEEEDAGSRAGSFDR